LAKTFRPAGSRGLFSPRSFSFRGKLGSGYVFSDVCYFDGLWLQS
jgi:hypothetical protein